MPSGGGVHPIAYEFRQRLHPARPGAPGGRVCGLRLRREQDAACIAQRVPALWDRRKGRERSGRRGC